MERIPSEIFFHKNRNYENKHKSDGIFTFISLKDLINLKRTCKFFRDRVNNSFNNNIIKDFYFLNILKAYLRLITY